MRTALKTVALALLWLAALLSGPLSRVASAGEDQVDVAMLGRWQIGGMTLSGLSVSPDGRHAAFEMHRARLATNDYQAVWMVLPLQGRGGRQAGARPVADVGDPRLFQAAGMAGMVNGAWVSRAPRWSPDSRWLAVPRLTDGIVQFWRMRPDGTALSQLTRADADVEAFDWSADGIRYATDASRAEVAGVLADEGARGWRVDDRFWPDIARPVLPAYALTGGQPRRWHLDPISGVVTAGQPETSRQDPADRATSLSPRPNSERAWLAPIAGSADKILAASPPGGRTRYCRHRLCRMAPAALARAQSWWADQHHVLLLTAADDGLQRLLRWQVATGAVTLVPLPPGRLADCQPAAGRTVCLHEAATSPARLVSLSVTGVVRTLYDPNSDLDPGPLAQARRRVWTLPDGSRAWGQLVLPDAYRPGTRYPLVLVGYRAWRFVAGGTGDEVPIRDLARHGFVVLNYDRADPPRHSTTPLKLGEQADARVDAADVTRPATALLAVIDTLDAEGLIDRDRVGLATISAGSTEAAHLLLCSRALAAVSLASFDPGPQIYWIMSDVARRQAALVGYGRQGTLSGRNWPLIALTDGIDAVSAPLLVQSRDSEVLGTWPAHIAFTDAKKPLELRVFLDEGHILWQPRHRQAAQQRVLDWFRFWLKGEENPGSAEPDQYARWRRWRDHPAAVKTPRCPG